MLKLYIDNENINSIYNCDYLSIKELIIEELYMEAPENINLIFNEIYKFTNLQKLAIYHNQITEIKGLDNLVNLQELILYNTEITEIKGLNKLTSLQKLSLYDNKITEIKGLNTLVNLQELILSNNQITEIKGLDNLVNLQKISLSNNKIREIKNLDNLINLKVLNLDNNKITEIKELNTLASLQILNLSTNKIKEITRLDNLVNLQYLNLSYNQLIEIKNLNKLASLQQLFLYNNQLTEIKELNALTSLQILNISNNQLTEIKNLDHLINLQQIYLYNNQITEIKNLDNLINLKKINLSTNQITEIKGLNTLTGLQNLNLNINKITEIKGINALLNLQKIQLSTNKITELPLSLCNLRNINHIVYNNNPIEYIPLPVKRWLNLLNRRITVNNMVYNDNQNIHNHHIQNSFQASLNNILKDKQLLDLQTIKQQILENDVLLEQTKREILNYCDDDTTHTRLLITYSDLLIYVWSRITFSTNKNEILQILNQEINDGLCMCFTGRLTRLLNTLVGFYDDIELQISDSEQITNIIMALKDKFPSNQEQLKDAVRKELQDRQYSESIINEWLDYI
jgi:Leucine-rich repeat (LRR) protein